MADQQEVSPTYLLRGPMIATAAIVSFATPYILQLSPRTLGHLAIILLAMLWFCWDLVKCIEHQSRIILNNLLDNLVLDDILRMIYDPEEGLIACTIGSFFGGLTMYGLNLGEQDKTRLVQATLEIDYNQANSLLLTPGGCKQFLPKGLQQWLNPSNSKSVKAIEYDGEGNNKNVENDKRDEEEEEEEDVSSSGSIPVSPISVEPLKKPPPPRDPVEEEYDNGSHEDDFATPRSIPSKRNFFESRPQQKQQRQRPTMNPTDPVDEMVSILRRLAYSQAKPYIQRIPERLLETVGLSAVAMMGAHMSYRYGVRRQRHSSLGMVGNLLLAGVASGAISTVVAKRMILKGDSFQTVCREMMTRSWQSIKDAALSKEQWQKYLAMVVLMILGKRPR